MQDKHLYEYAVIRIVPKIEREEFINVGLIMFRRKGWRSYSQPRYSGALSLAYRHKKCLYPNLASTSRFFQRSRTDI